MGEFLRPVLELMVLLPGMLLAYLPMKQYLRIRPAVLTAVAVPLALLLCLAGGAVGCFFHVDTVWLFFPAVAVMGFFYIHTLQITRWKSVSVFLAVCGVFCCLGSAAIAVSGILNPGKPVLPLSLSGALFWLVVCCLSVLAVWHPTTHAARQLLEEEAFAQTWYVFWIVPLLFVGLNLSMVPRNPWILEQGRLRQLYLLFSLALLILLLSFYVLFYLMASSLNRNDRLRRENHLLSMQQARYDSLRAAIEQTRHARHDMRHHLHILQSFAAQGNWEGLAGYLDEVQGSIPDGSLCLCENMAVDGVAGYFAALYREQGLPLTIELDLSPQVPVPETDLCSVLSNLLENAMEAGLRTAPERRQTKVQARLHSGHMVLLSVENAYDGKIREKDGVFLSSKRPGEGGGPAGRAPYCGAERGVQPLPLWGRRLYRECDTAGREIAASAGLSFFYPALVLGRKREIAPFIKLIHTFAPKLIIGTALRALLPQNYYIVCCKIGFVDYRRAGLPVGICHITLNAA